jgi:hypothetical protein
LVEDEHRKFTKAHYEKGALMDAGNSAKVLGKMCPCCGQAGWVLLETKRRIVYECPNKHEYETIKWLSESRKRSGPLGYKSLTNG